MILRDGDFKNKKGELMRPKEILNKAIGGGIILVYDITNRESFKKISTKYSEYLKNDKDHNYRLRTIMLIGNTKQLIIILYALLSDFFFIGNKSDLESERQVSTENAQEVRINSYLLNLNIFYFFSTQYKIRLIFFLNLILMIRVLSRL
jgi:GTPase SAR1 family protein